MVRRTLTAATVAAGLCLSGGAAAQGATEQKTITALGVGQIAVKPANPSSDSSIAAAVAAARHAALPLALADARLEAQAVAQAGGLTLGSVQALSEASGDALGPFGPQFGPFGPAGVGPGHFCGRVPTPVFGHAKRGHPRRLLRVVRRRRCLVPPFAVVQLSVTFTAS